MPFPGAPDPDAFWSLIREGRNAIRDVPPDRWDCDAIYDPTGARPGTSHTRWGGFLDDLAEFDADFFGISAREAKSLDPQHRLLLETCVEALEQGDSLSAFWEAAGPASMSGSERANMPN